MANDEPTKGQIHTREDQPTGAKSGVNHLLAIGINTYQHWNTLNNAVKDVHDMRMLLQEEYQFEEENTRILIDKDATRTNILKALEHLTDPNHVKPEDSVLIYYSGHGHVIQRGNEKNRGFWIPVDAQKSDNSGYLRNSVIREYIEDIPALHILLISDACFSGSLLVRGEIRASGSLKELRQRKSRWGLCSGRADEVVADGRPGQNSPFAAAIIDELKNNKAPLLNVQKLAVNVVDLTRRNYKQLPEGAPIFGVGDNGGQFLFERKKDETAIWKSTLEENSITAFQAYIAAFPTGNFVQDAQKQISSLKEEAAWKQAQEVNSLEGYEKYLLIYPKGPFAKEALDSIKLLEEEQAWKKAQGTQRFSDFYQYLRDYPQGKYAEEARQIMERKRPGTEAVNIPPPAPPPRKTPKQNAEQKKEVKPVTNLPEKKLEASKPNPKKPFPWKVAGIAVGALALIILIVWGFNTFGGDKAETSWQDAFDEVITYPNDTFAVRSGELWGFATASGEVFLKPVYQGVVKPFRNDLAVVALNGNTVRVNALGEIQDVQEVEENEAYTKVEDHSSTADKKKTDPKEILKEIASNMVLVEGGSFTMGCKDGRDTDCQSDEKPPHPVNISGFYISKYEVTQKQWRDIMGSDPRFLRFKGCDNCPVEKVSWDDIQGFIKKLNSLSGKQYRLPTEAEWEFASRGGNKSKGYKFSGSNTLGNVAWYYSSNSGSKTHPVGSKAPNELGLYDMSGNVYELCQDCWNNSYKGAPNDGSAWLSGDCSKRALRGGAWSSDDSYCRVTDRNGYPSISGGGHDSGFRLARN